MKNIITIKISITCHICNFTRFRFLTLGEILLTYPVCITLIKYNCIRKKRYEILKLVKLLSQSHIQHRLEIKNSVHADPMSAK
jgi:hypothetical protein